MQHDRYQNLDNSFNLFIKASLCLCLYVVQDIRRCLSATSLSQQNYPLISLFLLKRLSHRIVSAASQADFSLSFIFSQKSGMAVLTEGVSDHPGCIDTNTPLLGYSLANYSMMHSCCRLFLAYCTVPSKSYCYIQISRVYNFWVRQPPELTAIVLDYG